MTIAHIPFPTWGDSNHHKDCTVNKLHARLGASESFPKSQPAPGEPCEGMVSFPWEGLYFESGGSATLAAATEELGTQKLEIFLASLMYGE